MRLITKAAVSSGEGITNQFSSMTGSPCTEVQRSGYLHTSEHIPIGPTLEMTFSSTLCGHININSCFKRRMSYHLENIIVSWQLILETGRYKRKVLPYTALVHLLFPEYPLLASVKSRMLGQIPCCYSSWGSKFRIKHLRFFDNNSCISCSGGGLGCLIMYSYHSGEFKYTKLYTQKWLPNTQYNEK